MSGSSMHRVVFIPGYRENTEAMLAKLKKVRQNPPMKYVSDERFNALVNYAEEKIAEAIELEAEASENPAGRNYAREFYVACCDNARKAIYTSYDEPLARMGKSAQGGRSGGGATTAELRKAEQESHIAAAVALWQKLERQGVDERNRSSIIAQRMEVTPRTVREWLKKAEVR